jgi:hypothetical protein
MSKIHAEHFTKALLLLLEETFDSVYGLYLDKGTSLFETLATITADEASIPIGKGCASLAAQVSHVSFYLDVLDRVVRNPELPKVDWNEIWSTVSRVTPDEWAGIQEELRSNYGRILALVKDAPAWPSEREIAGAIAVVAHTAYHLGEIRQALCILRT